MAHPTGVLQTVFSELLIDEINHMTKFWGFGCWAYSETSGFKVGITLLQAMQEKRRSPHVRGSLFHPLRRMAQTLHWVEWSFTNQVSLMYTFGRIMYQLLPWHQRLAPEYLRELLGKPGVNYEAGKRTPVEAMNFS
ncbi:MAG: hypothetical protein F6J97_08905 [Leptolyngbya sp. SIO4C1]|nr:hypothetical protein [Leptolyngbya sp. SIO4C1]